MKQNDYMNANPKIEKNKYMERIARMKSKGLRDVKFYAANIVGVSEEDAYAELNRLHDAPDLPDKEILGKYSPA
jgi:hypothetical protein